MKLGPYELNTAILGDCIEVMRQIPDNSIDSIITDPPYGLGNDPDMLELLGHWLNDKDYDTGPGFMSRAWDVVPGPAIWRECFRVLKPGGALMAFGGTRTCDLLSIAIRLAGFQRFDQIVWIHGQGFGKGADISKKLDAMAGAEREVIGVKPDPRFRYSFKNSTKGEEAGHKYGKYNGVDGAKVGAITAPATEAAALWSGYRSQLKPAHEVILCFWKPREKSFAFNALKWGVAGLNIDECRIALTDYDLEEYIPNRIGYKDGLDHIPKYSAKSTFRSSLGPSKPFDTKGRYPANVLLSHHPDCVRVGVKRVRGSHSKPDEIGSGKGHQGMFARSILTTQYADPDGLESVPDYRCHPDCPVGQLDRQAGVRKSGAVDKRGYSGKKRSSDVPMLAYEKPIDYVREESSGSASRFFYCPKAPPREKWFYCEICDDVYPYKERDDHAHGKPKGQRKHQVAHPTVKPLSIVNYTLGVLEYLCRLTKTPTGGVILDPFGGSGTTALAAIASGRDFLIIENDLFYHRIAQKRIEQAMNEPRQLELAL